MGISYTIYDEEGNYTPVMDRNGEPVQPCLCCGGQNGSEYRVVRTYLAGANERYEWVCEFCRDQIPRCDECGHLVEHEHELTTRRLDDGDRINPPDVAEVCCACLPNGWDGL